MISWNDRNPNLFHAMPCSELVNWPVSDHNNDRAEEDAEKISRTAVARLMMDYRSVGMASHLMRPCRAFSADSGGNQRP